MTLPARPLDRDGACVSAPPARKTSGWMARVHRPTVVLVVDDDVNGRETCAEFLEACGFSVLNAPDGAAAIEIAIERNPDLVLMDLDMPTMGGLEALRRLKADDRTRAIPVVMLTGSSASVHDEAERAGCSAYLLKPCAPADLEGVVRAVVAANAVAGVR